MACILEKSGRKLFISYAPGTASTSLEQHLRTHESELIAAGFTISHYPHEEFGMGSEMTRHICYAQYLDITKNPCDFVATGTRNPFSFYFAEYNRILSKWSKLLENPESWIFKYHSRETLRLTLLAKTSGNFDNWFYNILADAEERGYLAINEDHLDKSTHYIRTENTTDSMDKITLEIFGVAFSDLMGEFPVTNISGYSDHYSNHTKKATRILAERLFHGYMEKFDYQYDDLAEAVI